MTLLSAFWDFIDSLLPYLPLLPLAAAIYSFYKAVKNRQAGYDKKIRDAYGNEKWVTGEGKLPIYKIPAFGFGIGFLIIAVIIFILLQIEI